MSIKFRNDGSCFPTEVKNGNLIIYIGTRTVSIPFNFLKEDFPKDNIRFPMSNIMCYLENDTKIIVMRFDGTVTAYTHDLEVIGFTKFDSSLIYQHIFSLNVGIVGVNISKGKTTNHVECTIYSMHETGEFIFEVAGDLEHIVFRPEDNPEFVDDILHGTRYYPRLEKTAPNVYTEDNGRYILKGYPVKTDKIVNV